MRRALIVLLAALALPATASAAPNRSVALNAVGESQTWQGGPISGATATSDVFAAVGCQPGVTECDDTLVQVTTRGILTATTGNGSAGASDLDLYLYASDASGAAGDALKSSAGPDANETVSTTVSPGYYLVGVASATSVQGTFTGSAKLGAAPAVGTGGDNGSPVGSGATPPPPDPGSAPPPPAGSTPAVNAAPSSFIASPRAGRKRTIRRITGTTSDDGDVKGVTVGIVRETAKGCVGLNARARWVKLAKCTVPPMLAARGTVSWTLTLKRALAPGRYFVYARAVDTDGAVEGGYGRENAVPFTIRR